MNVKLGDGSCVSVLRRENRPQVSCIFYNNCKDIFQPILYFPKNPLLVTAWGLLMCLAVSFVFEKGVAKIRNCKNELFKL